jgi:hypothetical protein
VAGRFCGRKILWPEDFVTERFVVGHTGLRLIFLSLNFPVEALVHGAIAFIFCRCFWQRGSSTAGCGAESGSGLPQSK